MGRVTQESDDINDPTFITTFDYDGAGRLIATAKYENSGTVSQSAFAYNGFGVKESETITYGGDANTAVTISYSYDQSGNIASQDDTKTGTTLVYTHDGLGRIKTVAKDATTIATYSYIGQSTKALNYNAAGIGTTHYFDDIGRLEEISSAMDSTTLLDFVYTYDDLFNRTSVKYNHLATPVYDNYTYDNLRRLTYVEYGSSSGVSMADNTFDIRLAAAMALEWLNSETIDYTVLIRHRLTQINTDKKRNSEISGISEIRGKKSSVPSVAKGNMPILTLVEMGDSNDTRTETITDDDGNKTAEIIYDNQDRMVSFTIYLPDGGKVAIESTFNANGTSTDVSKEYDASGALVSTETVAIQSAVAETPQPVIAETQAASIQPPVAIVETSSAAPSVLIPQANSLDLGGGMMMLMGAPSGPTAASEEFGYDNLGNRVDHYTKDGMTETYYHNSINQYTQIHVDYGWGGFTWEEYLDHDDNGNLDVDRNGLAYTYDYRNRLVEASDGISAIVQYTYDSLGRRIKKVTDSNTTYYYYDTMGRVIAEVSNNEWERSFVYGNRLDEMLAMFNPEEPEEPYDANGVIALAAFCGTWLCDSNDACYNATYDYDSSGTVDLEDYAVFASNWIWTSPPPPPTSGPETRWYYLHDALGSVMGVVGGKFGREDDREFYLYDAYGQCDSTSSIGNPYFFTGKRVDSETGLQDNVNRTYNYMLGRWMQIDPLGIVPNNSNINPFGIRGQYKDGLDLYEYVTDNPATKTDPYGLEGSSQACCKINKKEWGWKIVPPFAIPWKVTSCSQETIGKGPKADADAACKCAYKNRPNIQVYGSHNGPCCSCNVYIKHSPVNIYGIEVDAHAAVYVECEQGRGQWGADVGLGNGTDGPWFKGKYVTVDMYTKSEGGTYQGTISCDVADKWRNSLTGMQWWYQYPLHDCRAFASYAANGMLNTCP
jgi:RHS repeat-associated protein